MITRFASAGHAKRILLPEDKASARQTMDGQLEGKKKSFGLKQVLISSFGLYLLILIWIAALAAGVAVLLLFVGLWQAKQRRRVQEKAPELDLSALLP